MYHVFFKIDGKLNKITVANKDLLHGVQIGLKSFGYSEKSRDSFPFSGETNVYMVNSEEERECEIREIERILLSLTLKSQIDGYHFSETEAAEELYNQGFRKIK